MAHEAPMVADKKPGVTLLRSADKLLATGRIGRERFLHERVHSTRDQLQAEGYMRRIRCLCAEERIVNSLARCEDARRSELAAHCKDRGVHLDKNIRASLQQLFHAGISSDAKLLRACESGGRGIDNGRQVRLRFGANVLDMSPSDQACRASTISRQI